MFPHASSMFALFAQGAFYIMLLVATVYAVVLGYHWFTYGNSKHTSTVALTLYLSGAALLLLTMAVSALSI